MKVPIETALSTCPRLITLEANAEEIRKYVSYQLDMDVHHGDMDESFRQMIRDKVVEIADGMFLLPALQIQTVLEQNSISKRREALNTMPKKLDDAFQATVDRIRQQSLSKSTQGLEVLKWIFFAFRQLTIAGLRHALAVNEYDTSTDSLDLNKLPFEKSLTDCRHGLVVVDQETSSIRPVHKSLQDFLTKEHETDKLFINGHCENFSCLSDLFETQLQNNGR
ncbi:Similar to unnamed protein product [Aspergillus oryzae RIB40]; acc. no. BAE57037 [Pyronema omphalodes CBS 100304]|uniref:Similar to unnamed protein product [Aspergillus oryzae RIB40] acc. no. BAE57037 n=1 Tax=Pyronema omphalodes (strain CBS 100304) TaxID=1076935 RepID=U4L122_PYROM|nr:Similar to unnamed protein product [Aspergillus oryzae RIB40]; acc. no. BAE57037 [Pyronema omphalodes CBS 100304]